MRQMRQRADEVICSARFERRVGGGRLRHVGANQPSHAHARQAAALSSVTSTTTASEILHRTVCYMLRPPAREAGECGSEDARML